MIATKTPAIDKAARIFHFIAGKGSATYSEIHQNVGLPQSTTSALLASLTTHAFLRQKNGRYYLGLIFYELGNKAIQDFDFRELAEESLVFLRDQTRLACHLGVLDGSTGIYLAKKRKPECDYRSQLDGKTTFPAQFLPWESVVGLASGRPH
ncbi:helix-turn-helix domain-containing protein [Escherichia coli]|uniref:helix-turn-helix domain-containing protein n=1 Tax=Escherichia coli TaxID=562 RepID=UPI0001E5B81C|nr:helix-turn-helix domain-containing protein [Escherichia coli]EFO55332.1 IclR helix-turn-helix domain protein [Escherichia coli MS 145-7]